MEFIIAHCITTLLGEVPPSLGATKKENAVIYTVDAIPIPWQRAGLSSGGKFYDRQVHNKLAFGLIVSKQHNDKPVITQPIHLDIQFHFQKPRTHKEIIPHIVKPDIDNLVKFVLDALKDILWVDDKIIYKLTCEKKYSPTSQTIITIKELE